MKPHMIVKSFVVATLLTAPLVICAVAQDDQVGSPPAAKSTATASNRIDSVVYPATTAGQTTEPNQPTPLPHSPVIEEILKMVDAGVSKDVIKTYIESASIADQLDAADLIALKARAVTDDITTALVKRSAAVRAQAIQANAVATAPDAVSGADNVNGAPPPDPAGNPGYAYPDPETYNYWWYYYAYPRTLAYANQRMGVYSSPYAFNYGYYQPLPFSPYPYPARSVNSWGVAPMKRGGAVPPSRFGGPPVRRPR